MGSVIVGFLIGGIFTVLVLTYVAYKTFWPID